ncbi:hypothetical protein [Flavihumibacter fluvii]|uniref:hypothetical protein n=1 Tax=Flavihumibacter fluvii TaxID=2838157 RepID=UPI001BDE140E|nr:hypothetical protein [Flavihumibacter fluvii]ULQ52155.1 hypothetical protein KJS93_18855 [Flavihumibacter fluvii]
MLEKKQKKPRVYPKSKQPYKRRTEAEMSRIINEIQQGVIGKRAACHKYGLNRNTLHLWITRLAIGKLNSNLSKELIADMNENQQNIALTKKIRELTSALERTELKVITLETIIKVAEEDLQIKIRKKSGTKQSKE